MKALCWIGGETVRIEDVPEPKIINPRDAIVKVSSTAICGSDRHLFHGYIPTMQPGDILGHEFMGEVVEVGGGVSERSSLRVGDRVLVPFNIGCGNCFFCQRQPWSLCDNSNPNGHLAAGLYGYTPSDNVPERLAKAQSIPGTIALDYDKVHVLETLQDLTGGMGPDACIDAVGLEAHGASVDAMVDRTKAALWMATDRPHVLREAIQACLKGGIVSIPGVYGGLLDKLNFGAAFNKGLTFKMGQMHVHRYVKPLMEKIEREELDARFIITHRLPLSEAPHGYDIFCRKKDDCVKVVLKP